MSTGRLFVVATPIGNLEDMTPRAVQVLLTVDLIAAEDTRHSRRLLDHFGIRTRVTSYHEHNEAARTRTLLEALQSGQDVALITDAGTPCVSDPGIRVVQAAHDHHIQVVPVPGPSAVVAALAASGLPPTTFTFHGFLPRKRSAGEKLLRQALLAGGTHLFFESPNRLVAALRLLDEVAPDSAACVARELTKIHEEILRGVPAELAGHYAANPPRGECVLLVNFAPARADSEALSAEQLRSRVEAAMRERGLTRRDAIREVAGKTGLPRNRVYDAARGDT